MFTVFTRFPFTLLTDSTRLLDHVLFVYNSAGFNAFTGSTLFCLQMVADSTRLLRKRCLNPILALSFAKCLPEFAIRALLRKAL